MLEKKLKLNIYSYLYKHEKKRKLTFLRNFVGYFRDVEGKKVKIGRKGFSDFTVFLKTGKVLFIELKTETGTISEEQNKFKSLIENLDYEYHIVRSTSELYYIFNNNRVYVGE